MLTTGTQVENAPLHRLIEQFCDEPCDLIVSPVGLGDLEQRKNIPRPSLLGARRLEWMPERRTWLRRSGVFGFLVATTLRPRRGVYPDVRLVGLRLRSGGARVRLPTRRGLDLGVGGRTRWPVTGPCSIIRRRHGMCNPGGATIIRKAFWHDFPERESLLERARGRRAVPPDQRAGKNRLSRREHRDRRRGSMGPRIAHPVCDQHEVLFGGGR